MTYLSFLRHFLARKLSSEVEALASCSTEIAPPLKQRVRDALQG